MNDIIVDVSKHNGTINWPKAKAAGVVAAIIRCGYGTDKEKNDDPLYLYNMNEAKNAGVKIGVYLYSYAKDFAAAESEAAHAIRLITPFRDIIKLPIFYDVEEPGTEKGVSDRCRLFCERIKKEGFTPGIYANIDWWRDYLKNVNQYTKWIAKWSEPKPDDFMMELWQYDAYGTVPGIGSGVDLNKAYGKVKEIIEETEPTPKPEGDTCMVELAILKRGMKDTNGPVTSWQGLLRLYGYTDDSGAEIKLDGSYGPKTEQATKKVQKKHGLTITGVVNSAEWHAIIM